MTAELDALSRTLEQRAASVHLRGSSFEDVRGRARRIRRRRRAIAGAGVAAALVVAVPLGLGLGTPTALQPAPPAGSVTAPPSVPPTAATATPTPVRANALSAAGAPRGADPAVPYVVGRELRVPGGATVTLPDRTYFSVTGVGDQWWALATDPGAGGPLALLQFDAGGRLLATHPLEGGPVVSGDGDVIAWTAAGGAFVYSAGADRPRQVRPSGTGWPVGVVGTAPCLTADDCTVYLHEQPEARPEVERFLAVSPDGRRGAFVGPVAGGASCPGVGGDVAGGGATLWQSCGVNPLSFSPDGSRLLVTTSDSEGRGESGIAVVDAGTGRELARWTRGEADAALPVRAVWEDDAHVLVLSHEDGDWRLLRLGVDGSTQSATDPVPGPDDASPIAPAVG